MTAWLLILMLIYGACVLYLIRASRAPRRPPVAAPPAGREAWEVPAEVGFRVGKR